MRSTSCSQFQILQYFYVGPTYKVMKRDFPGKRDYFFCIGRQRVAIYLKIFLSADGLWIRHHNAPGSKELDEFPALCFRSLCLDKALLFNLDHFASSFYSGNKSGYLVAFYVDSSVCFHIIIMALCLRDKCNRTIWRDVTVLYFTIAI